MAQYDKNYKMNTWKDKPSTDTAINAYRLNKMENGINTVDNRVVALSQDKLEVSEANQMVKNVTLNTQTGVMTVTLKNGTQTTYNLVIGKIVINFDLDANNNLVLTLADGTIKTVSLAALVDTYTFTSSETISFTTNGKNITAIIPDGAVTLAKLEATVISTIRQYTLDAQTAKGQAEQAAATAQGYAIGGEGFEGTNAQLFAGQSKRYAVITDEAPTDNAQYYSQQAAASAATAEHIIGFDGTAGAITATDVQGLVAAVGGASNVQALLDALAKKVAKELVSNTALAQKLAGYLLKSQVVNNLLATVPGNALDAVQGKALGDAVTKVNRDLASIKNVGFGRGTDLNCGIDDGIKDCNDLPVGSIAYVYGNAKNCPYPGNNSIVLTIGLSTLYTQIAIQLYAVELKIRTKYTSGWIDWAIIGK